MRKLLRIFFNTFWNGYSKKSPMGYCRNSCKNFFRNSSTIPKVFYRNFFKDIFRKPSIDFLSNFSIDNLRKYSKGSFKNHCTTCYIECFGNLSSDFLEKPFMGFLRNSSRALLKIPFDFFPDTSFHNWKFPWSFRSKFFQRFL